MMLCGSRAPLPLLLLVLVACDGKGAGGEDTAAADVIDNDGDGFGAEEDCDDADAAIYPGAAEQCDEIDNNCDGSIDEGVLQTYYYDNDRDGYGDPDTPKSACTPPDGFVADGTDCEDLSDAIYPGAEERCDAVDSDCDGTTEDADAVDMRTGYQDSDGDGYGDPSQEVIACVLDADYVEDSSDCDDLDARTYPGAAYAESLTDCLRDGDGDGYGDATLAGTDCDDTSAAIHPGALDTCDGLDNDCNAATGEENSVAWRDSSGSWSDMTAAFAAGTSSSPARISPTSAGTLHFCGGRWYAGLSLTQDTTIVALSPTTLSGAAQRPVVLISGDKLSISLSGLTLENGTGTTNATFSRTAGGGLQCSGDNELWVDDTVITGNKAEVGAGVFIDGCTAALTGVELSSNDATFGGGMFLFEGDVVMTDSLVIDNTATTTGGGIDVEAPSGATLELIDSVVTGNTGYYGGGVVAIYAARVSCTGARKATAGVMGNTATYGGGVLTYFSTYTTGSFTAVDCDLGTADGRDDNAPEDVHDYDLGVLYSSYGEDASFTCTPGRGCY